jgi:hypothetical protein
MKTPEEYAIAYLGAPSKSLTDLFKRCQQEALEQGKADGMHEFCQIADNTRARIDALSEPPPLSAWDDAFTHAA